jgi:hypothetical protein
MRLTLPGSLQSVRYQSGTTGALARAFAKFGVDNGDGFIDNRCARAGNALVWKHFCGSE